MNRRLFPISSFRRKGFALVITLAALVIITVLVLAFFSRALLNRQISFSSTNMAKTRSLAKTSLDFVTDELQQEIVDGSVVPDGINKLSQNGVTIYQPLTASNTRPAKIGVVGPDEIGTRTIAKVSAGNLSVRPAGTNMASTVSVATASMNGRHLSAARWFGEGGPGLGSQTNLPTWFYVTRENGIKTPTVAAAKDAAGGDYTVGRFAFTVYNVSGLLDANVAGYPAVAATNAGSKSSEAWADLTALDATFPVETFTTWRNGATDNASTANYESYLRDFAASRGFLSAKLGHNIFFSRKDLLNAASSGLMPSQATPYLTHFSRSASAPGWKPAANSQNMNDYVGGGGTVTIAYLDDANEADGVNRFVPNVRISSAGTVTHYADDGITETCAVRPGDSLLKRPFSLARLKWLGWDGPVASAFAPSLSGTGRAKAIKDCFGLTWDNGSGRWIYDASLLTAFTRSGAPDFRLRTLEEIAAEGREPNFFEMLNAGILHGSLGQHPGSLATFDLGANFDIFSGSRARHIFQIGANIIDQYDPDSYPTLIYASTGGGGIELEQIERTLAGVENLPYFQRLHALFYVDPLTSTLNDPDNQNMKYWLAVEVWNMHQQARTVPADRPSRFRVRAFGSVHGEWRLNGTSTATYSGVGLPVHYDTDPVAPSGGSTYRNIYFTDLNAGEVTSPFFNNPRILRTDFMTTGVGGMDTPAINQKPASLTDANFMDAEAAGFNASLPNFPYLAIYAGEAPYTRSFNNPLLPVWGNDVTYTTPKYVRAGIRPDPQYTFSLECFDGTRWRPYTSMGRVAQVLQGELPLLTQNKPAEWTIKGEGGLTPGWWSFGHAPDPRTDRFSLLSRRVRRDDYWRQERSLYAMASAGAPKNYHFFPERNYNGDFPDPATTVFRYLPGPDTTAAAPGDEKVIASDYMKNVLQPGFNFNLWSASATYYADTDGVVRPADGFRQQAVADSMAGDGFYLLHYSNTFNRHTAGQARRRPVILNRPFQSVADLGYAYRDLPGRNLDFWSANSADAALLDLFSVTDSPAVSAGKLSLTESPPAVMEAILRGATKASLPGVSTNETISTAEASTLSSAVATRLADLSQPPLADRSDLVLQLAATIDGAITDSTTGTPFKRNKAWAEAPVRALSQVSQIRTWNLLIDLVAQTGKLSPSATGLENFVVEGERRYWLHIAIDRLTGQVVSRQLEPVL